MITIDHSKFDIKKVNLSDKQPTHFGDKWYFGYGNNNDNYDIMTPELNIPFGIDCDKENKKYIRCELVDHYYDDEVKNFFNILRFLEELVKLKLSQEIPDKQFFSTLKIPEDPKYPPSIRVKLNFRYRRYEVDFYDRRGDRTISSSIKKGTNVKMKLCPKEIWVNDDYYGILWNTSQVMIMD